MKKKLLLFVSLFGLLCIPLPTIAEEQDCTPETSTTTVSLSLPTFPEGVSSLKAVFEVAPATEYSDAKKVVFSQGNLKFNNYDSRICADGKSYKGTFEFSSQQYIRVNGSQNLVNESMDLFVYGSSGYNNMTPNSTCTNATHSFVDEGENKYSNYDWGVFNPIKNGGNQPGMWRSMTADEWQYIINTCKNNGRFGLGQVICSNDFYGINNHRDYVYGMILLPEGWVAPSGTPDFVPGGNSASCSDNVYTPEQWLKMSDNGAVFIPTAPERRCGGDVRTDNVQTGSYWTATYSNGRPLYLSISSSPSISSPTEYTDHSTYHYAVRLVHDL